MTISTINADEELVSRYTEGDRDAFDELVQRYSDDISRFTTWMVHDPTATEEITQTTFLRTQVALDRKRLPRVFKPWFFQIAKNASRDYLKERSTSQKKLVSLPEGEDAPEGGYEVDPSRWNDPFESIRAEEIKGLVWQAIGSLSLREREVLVLHDLEGWNPEEIAAVVNSRTGAVHTRLSRARDAFEDAVAALVLMRRGREDCPELNQIVEDVGGDEFTSVLRLRILRHLRGCEICGENRRRLVSASELLGALVPLPLALAAREKILANWNSNGTAPDPKLGPGQSPAGRLLSQVTGAGPWAVISIAVSLAAAVVALVIFLLAGSGGTRPLLTDTLPPSDPSIVRSTSHILGSPSTDRTVEITWSEAVDQEAGADLPQDISGVDGFSIEWSMAPDTLPDATKDLDSHVARTTSPLLSPGSWWFHLRTVDKAGNWTSTVHLGPFVIIPVSAPTPTPTPIPLPTSAPTPTPTQSPTAVPTPIPTPTPAPTASPTPTAAPTPTPTMGPMVFAISILQAQTPTAIDLGDSATFDLVLFLISGVGSPVDLKSGGVPETVTIDFSVNPETPVMGDGTTISVTISTKRWAPPGIYFLTITGESDTSSQLATIKLQLLAESYNGGGGDGGDYTVHGVN